MNSFLPGILILFACQFHEQRSRNASHKCHNNLNLSP